MLQELRRQADDQPDKEKILWKRHLSQQADYRAEIHELHTELLNMKERSEMESHLAASMCRIEQSVPSRTVEAEPENVLNTLSPGKSTRWILPSELETESTYLIRTSVTCWCTSSTWTKPYDTRVQCNSPRERSTSSMG